MSDNLINFEENKNIISYVDGVVSKNPELKAMMANISDALPEIQRATNFFYKTQSQFMDNMLTVSHPTPLRNIRQILAEMNKTKEAIKEVYFKTLKAEIEIKIKRRDLDLEKDELKRELLSVEIAELVSKNETSSGYISGAVRKLANYTAKYMSIIKNHNLESFTEIDFEKEEERYHVMRAFDQALCAARTHNGLIDEGNMIYLTQIGINGAVAQKDISEYLFLEIALLKDGKEPTHKMALGFLNRMAQKHAGCSKEYAFTKGMEDTITGSALLTNVK